MAFNQAMMRNTRKKPAGLNPERDRIVADARRRGMEYADIAKEVGLTRERCRQICDAAGLPKRPYKRRTA